VEGATFKMDITVSLKNQMNKKSLVQILRNHENTGRMWAQYSNFPVSIHLYLHAMASYFRIIFFRSFHILVQFFERSGAFYYSSFFPKRICHQYFKASLQFRCSHAHNETKTTSSSSVCHCLHIGSARRLTLSHPESLQLSKILHSNLMNPMILTKQCSNYAH
jgi:hypothetical protein